MDADRFDLLTRSLTTTGSRRGAMAALLGGTLGLPDLADTAANVQNLVSHVGDGVATLLPSA